MSDYKSLSKKLLDDKKLTYEDYFDLLNDKNFYESHYNEYFRKWLELDSSSDLYSLFLSISVALNIGLLVALICG